MTLFENSTSVSDALYLREDFWRGWLETDIATKAATKGMNDVDKREWISKKSKLQAGEAHKQWLEGRDGAEYFTEKNLEVMLWILSHESLTTATVKNSGQDSFVQNYWYYQLVAIGLFAQSAQQGKLGKRIDLALREIATNYTGLGEHNAGLGRAMAVLALLRRGQVDLNFRYTQEYLMSLPSRLPFSGAPETLQVMYFLVGNEFIGQKKSKQILELLRKQLNNSDSPLHQVLVSRNWYQNAFDKSSLDFIALVRNIRPSKNVFIHELLQNLLKPKADDLSDWTIGDPHQAYLKTEIEQVIHEVWP